MCVCTWPKVDITVFNTSKNMRVFVCSCSHIISGRDDMEIMRKASDHIKLVHPSNYEEMLEVLSPYQIREWMKMHMITRKTALS